MRVNTAITVVLLGSSVAFAGCKNNPELQRDADQAAAATKEAGQKAGDALQRAGEQVANEAEKLKKAAEPTAEDLALTAKVKAKLAADPDVAALHVDVDTLEKVVTLSGRVTTDAERQRAEDLARRTDGVKAVINRLVAGNEPMAGAAPAPSPGR